MNIGIAILLSIAYIVNCVIAFIATIMLFPLIASNAVSIYKLSPEKIREFCNSVKDTRYFAVEYRVLRARRKKTPLWYIINLGSMLLIYFVWVFPMILFVVIGIVELDIDSIGFGGFLLIPHIIGWISIGQKIADIRALAKT